MTLQVAIHAGQLLQPFPGGIGRYVGKLIEALPQADITPIPFAAGAPAQSIPNWVNLGFPYGRWRYEAWHRFRRPSLRVRKLDGGEPEVIHAPSLAIPPHGRLPLVVTVHDLVFLENPDCLTPRGVAFHKRGLKIAIDEAAAFVVPSAWVANRLEACGVDRARIHVAHHGVDLDGVDLAVPDKSKEEQATNLPETFVLFVGTLEPRKGVAELISALSQVRLEHPDIELVMAGPSGWGELPDLSASHVHWLGSVDDSMLDHLYRHALGLVLPSRNEGFGLPILEAMIRGCPVIASEAACLPEIVGEAGTLVPVGNVETLAKAICELTDQVHRKSLIQRGLAHAAGFTWQASAQSHAGAYSAARATL